MKRVKASKSPYRIDRGYARSSLDVQNRDKYLAVNSTIESYKSAKRLQQTISQKGRKKNSGVTVNLSVKVPIMTHYQQYAQHQALLRGSRLGFINGSTSIPMLHHSCEVPVRQDEVYHNHEPTQALLSPRRKASSATRKQKSVKAEFDSNRENYEDATIINRSAPQVKRWTQPEVNSRTIVNQSAHQLPIKGIDSTRLNTISYATQSRPSTNIRISQHQIPKKNSINIKKRFDLEEISLQVANKLEIAKSTNDLAQKLALIQENRNCLLQCLPVPQSFIDVLKATNHEYEETLRELHCKQASSRRQIQVQIAKQNEPASSKRTEQQEEYSFTDAGDLCMSSDNDIVKIEADSSQQQKKVVVGGLKFNTIDRTDFQDDFLAMQDQFSESWRAEVKKMKRF